MKRITTVIIVILLVTGCRLFGSEGSGETMTTEASFTEISVKQFAHNRLVFEGVQKDEKAAYIYDMHQKTLTRKQGDIDWQQDDQRLRYLKDNRKLVLERSDNMERILLTDADGNDEQLVQAPINSGLQYSVAPNDASMLFWKIEGDETSLYLYDFIRGNEQKVTELSDMLDHDDIAWSTNGKYVMVNKRSVYSVPEGKEVLELRGGFASWSPTAAQLLIVEQDANNIKPPEDVDIAYGHRIIRLDMLSGEKAQLFPVKPDVEPLPLILDQPVWDQQGRYFAFITGSISGEQIVYEKVHVMDVSGGFHHVENEQNLRSSVIAGLSFDPSSNLFSYTAGGLLKVLHLPTQLSKVFDVYTQMQQEDSHYLKYSDHDAWVLADGEIKRLSNDLEEKTVYRSSHELRDFFVQSNGNQLLVIERDSDQYHLKLISLLEEETEK